MWILLSEYLEHQIPTLPGMMSTDTTWSCKLSLTLSGNAKSLQSFSLTLSLASSAPRLTSLDALLAAPCGQAKQCVRSCRLLLIWEHVKQQQPLKHVSGLPVPGLHGHAAAVQPNSMWHICITTTICPPQRRQQRSWPCRMHRPRRSHCCIQRNPLKVNAKADQDKTAGQPAAIRQML